MGFDPVSKVLPALVVGKRTKANAYKLIERIYRVTDGPIPLFTGDELRHYRDALLRVYGIREEVPKGPRRKGDPRKPKLRPPPELRYAQVVKHRRRGRVISLTTKVIFGNDEEVKECLEKSPVSRSVNISFVERNNLTLRQQSKRLGRKTNGFSKDIGRLEAQRTPAMAAGVTDHIWSTRELLIYRVP